MSPELGAGDIVPTVSVATLAAQDDAVISATEPEALPDVKYTCSEVRKSAVMFARFRSSLPVPVEVSTVIYVAPVPDAASNCQLGDPFDSSGTKLNN